VEGEEVSEPEKIFGSFIHPAASVFPLMEGPAFQRLVDSIAVHGVQNPIVCSGHLVLDGRNRLRAVEQLLNEGHEVALPAVQWKSENGMTETEWVEAQNLDRRHLSPDAFAAAAAALSRILRKEAKERQAATKLDGSKPGPGRGKKTVTTKPSSPQKRDRKADDARSTVGQVAAKAGTSMHKARQAVKLDQAVEAGVIPEEVQKDVIAGKKKLRDAVKQVPATPKPPRKPASKKKRRAADVLDDLRLLLSELLASDGVSRQRIVDELTTWIDRANNK
jgi:ParB-like chromosome segregation protein Spo0J